MPSTQATGLQTAAHETIDIATHRRRVVISGVIGTSIEWFDFLLYGLIAPAVFDRLFFPKLDPVAGTIAVLGVFAVGWMARPLGGIVFGHFGDRIGRKSILFITLALMGGSTTLMGLLPTYETIGVAAPLLLVVLRFLQGFALGGEVVGAVVLAMESAPDGRRGGFTALIQVGAAIGSLMAALAARLIAQLPQEAMLSWGWRIPFLLSFVLVLVGIYVRMKIAELPIFSAAVSARAPEKFPLITMLKQEPKPALIVFLTTITELGMLQIFTVFALAFSIQTLGIDRAILLDGIFLGNIAGIVITILWLAVGLYGTPPAHRRLPHLGDAVRQLCVLPTAADQGPDARNAGHRHTAGVHPDDDLRGRRELVCRAVPQLARAILRRRFCAPDGVAGRGLLPADCILALRLYGQRLGSGRLLPVHVGDFARRRVRWPGNAAREA